jgi:hypothetical protein
MRPYAASGAANSKFRSFRSMPRLYAAAYLVPNPNRTARRADPGQTARNFYKAVETDDFPYDVGDDPSFFAARYHCGPVTWGVCRPDVRGAIDRDDWMVFFAAQRDAEDSAITRYRFVAALCVEEKLSQVALFAPSINRPYRDYLNLLIRPAGGGWEHYEPLFDQNDRNNYHKDWLWRVCRTPRLRKKDVVSQGRCDKYHIEGTKRRHQVFMAKLDDARSLASNDDNLTNEPLCGCAATA